MFAKVLNKILVIEFYHVMKKKIIIGILSLLLIVIGLVSYTRNSPDPVASLPSKTQSQPGQPSSVPSIGELIIGDPQAPATITEYADYKCPLCNEFHQKAWQELKTNFIDTGKLKLVFVPYPVYGEDGAKAAYGSYCAKEQSKLTEYHDALFDYMWSTHYRSGDYDASVRDTLKESVLTSITDKLGIDKTRFLKCINEITYDDEYQAALKSAAERSVQGTPTFFINNQKIVGPQPYSIFKTLVEIQL